MSFGELRYEKDKFIEESPIEVVKKLRKKSGKDVWICGGANVVQQLIREDFIDCYYLTVVPTILGSGIRLFENTEHEIKLRLLKTQTYNGMIDLVYARR